MCLDPHTTFHPVHRGENGRRQQVCLTLERPIIVVKGLRCHRVWDDKKGGFKTMFESPYQWVPYKFGQTRSAKNMASKVYMDRAYIERGLHAAKNLSDFYQYFGNESEKSSMEDRSSTQYYDDRKYAFPAVIPAGARVWFGDRGDVAADTMTVYEDLKSIRKVYGSIAAPISMKKSVGL